MWSGDGGYGVPRVEDVVDQIGEDGAVGVFVVAGREVDVNDVLVMIRGEVFDGEGFVEIIITADERGGWGDVCGHIIVIFLEIPLNALENTVITTKTAMILPEEIFPLLHFLIVILGKMSGGWRIKKSKDLPPNCLITLLAVHCLQKGQSIGIVLLSTQTQRDLLEGSGEWLSRGFGLVAFRDLEGAEERDDPGVACCCNAGFVCFKQINIFD